MTSEMAPQPNRDESFVMRDSDEYEIAEQLPMARAMTDPVKDYLKTIGRTPLLDAEAEVELSKRIEAGLFAAHLLNLREKRAAKVELTEDEQALFNRWRGKVALEQLEWLSDDGQKAKKHMLEANLRLVVSLAKRYQGRGMEFLDLIEEGNLGLIRAVEKFDFKKGYKFSTYATWWIRQAITRGMAEQARTIRIPVHMVERINKMGRVERQLETDLGREPSTSELAKELGLAEESIVEMKRYRREPVSLDKPLGDGGGTGRGQSESYLKDIIADDQPAVDQDVSQALSYQQVIAICKRVLTERELDVFLRRHAAEPMTLDDIGADYGLTRERIRQIEAKAKTKLKAVPELRHMFDELD